MNETETVQKPPEDTESYRNSISTVDQGGKRVWIYPKKQTGPFYRARTIVSFFLLAFLFGAPFIKINGQPLLLFNIIERKFVIFGVPFWPQDFHIFALAFLSLVVFIILFTVIYGRLFCGWACPQTVFMEMVFRKIEYLIEGDAAKQRRLAAAPWDAEKVFKKGIKHSIFFALAFLIGNTFLAYIIGVDQLFEIITDPPQEHLTGLTAMIAFSLVFYWVFAYFREQACTLVCPYGRLQSVLLDQKSIVVAYDFKRGEPRGKFSKRKNNPEQGDCIDCNLCVAVCPTGIDIRNGTQLECVNCTACIDACNSVMERVGLPRDLIRYDSYNGIVTGEKQKPTTPRAIGYSVVLLLLVGFVTFLLLSRSDVETTVLRTPGQLYQETAEGEITNLYNYKVINKTFDELPIEIKLLAPAGSVRMVGQNVVVQPDALAEGTFFVEIPRQQVFTSSMMIKLGVYSEGELLEEKNTTFLGPNPK